jgi:hypothetical protein
MADEKYCTGDLQTLFSNYGTVTDVSISLIEKPVSPKENCWHLPQQ